jgi:hypothetical protein
MEGLNLLIWRSQYEGSNTNYFYALPGSVEEEDGRRYLEGSERAIRYARTYGEQQDLGELSMNVPIGKPRVVNIKGRRREMFEEEIERFGALRLGSEEPSVGKLVKRLMKATSYISHLFK